MNPLDWNGELFLVAYVPFLVLAYIVAQVWQHRLNQPVEAPERHELEDLEPYEVATLKGEEAAVDAAVVALVHAGRLRVQGGKLSVAGPLPEDAPRMERAVYAEVERVEERMGLGKAVLSPKELRGAAGEELNRLRESLRRRGFLRDWEQTSLYLNLPRALFIVALLLGVAKLWVGMRRGRAVGCLVAELLVLGPLGLWLLSMESRCSRRGYRALELLKEQYQPLRETASAEGGPRTMSAANMALAVGLFGVGAVALADFTSLRDYLVPPSSGDTGGSGEGMSGSESGGGSDSGGGGGCGGCGGGGGSD